MRTKRSEGNGTGERRARRGSALRGCAVAFAVVLPVALALPAAAPPSAADARPVLALATAAGLQLIARDGSGLTSILATDPREGVSGSAWRPDGSVIAFSYRPPFQFEGKNGADLQVVLPDGSGRRTLVEHDDADVTLELPQWSPDGNALYFTRSHARPVDARTVRTSHEVRRLDLASGGIETVLQDAGDASPSPDGSALVFVHYDGDRQSLWLADRDGANARPLFGGSDFAYYYSPRFAPDGQRIAVSVMGTLQPRAALHLTWAGARFALLGSAPARQPGGDWEIVGVALDRPEPITLTALQTIEQGISLAWSPDGTELAFLTSQGLNLMRADGSDLRVLNDQVGRGDLSWLAAQE